MIDRHTLQYLAKINADEGNYEWAREMEMLADDDKVLVYTQPCNPKPTEKETK